MSCVMMAAMSEVTRVLDSVEPGDPRAAAELLPLVYDELRKLAAHRLAQEPPGQTFEPTALVHEAYLRLVDVEEPQTWNGRGHFFAAAAESMRRILIDNARRKLAHKRGGEMQRVDLDEAQLATKHTPEQLLAIDDALSSLEKDDSQSAELFKLRYFAGCSIADGGELLGMSRATAYRHWTFARAWILRHVLEDK
jgi:RNA polymerase sigma factor (TIGR02999 family)